MKKVTLQGISAPVLTPFYENGGVNTEEYMRLIRLITKSGIKGIFVGGTSGEFINLRIEEREALLEAAREAVEEDTTLLFNVTAMNEHDLHRLMEYAKQKGADAVSVTGAILPISMMKNHYAVTLSGWRMRPKVCRCTFTI